MARYRFEIEAYSAAYDRCGPFGSLHEAPKGGFFFDADTAEEALKLAKEAEVDKGTGILGGVCLRVVWSVPLSLAVSREAKTETRERLRYTFAVTRIRKSDGQLLAPVIEVEADSEEDAIARLTTDHSGLVEGCDLEIECVDDKVERSQELFRYSFRVMGHASMEHITVEAESAAVAEVLARAALRGAGGYFLSLVRIDGPLPSATAEVPA